MDTIRAIIFDLDGVICFTDNYHYQAWKELADAEGIYFDEKINGRLRGVSRMESLDIILERSKDTAQLHQEVIDAVFCVEGKETKKALSHLQLFRTCSNRTCDCFCNLPPLYSQDRDASRNRNHCRKRNRNNYS